MTAPLGAERVYSDSPAGRIWHVATIVPEGKRQSVELRRGSELTALVGLTSTRLVFEHGTESAGRMVLVCHLVDDPSDQVAVRADRVLTVHRTRRADSPAPTTPGEDRCHA